MDTKNLFHEHKIARSTDPRNSQRAARRNRAGRMRARLRLLAAYFHHGQMSDEQAGTKASVPTAHKRVSELLREGLVEYRCDELGARGTAVRVCGLTNAGRECVEGSGVLGAPDDIHPSEADQHAPPPSVTEDIGTDGDLQRCREDSLDLLGACSRLIEVCTRHLPQDAPRHIWLIVEHAASIVDSITKEGGNDDPTA